MVVSSGVEHGLNRQCQPVGKFTDDTGNVCHRQPTQFVEKNPTQSGLCIVVHEINLIHSFGRFP